MKTWAFFVLNVLYLIEVKSVIQYNGDKLYIELALKFLLTMEYELNSEFTEAERAVRRFARSMSSSRNAIIVVSDQHELVWLDKEFTELSGYSLHNLRGTDISVLFASEHLKEKHPEYFKSFLEKSRKSKGVAIKQMFADRDIEILGKEGNSFFAKITLFYFQHEETEMEFAIGVMLPKGEETKVTITNNYDTKIGLLMGLADAASAKWKQLAILAIFLGIGLLFYGCLTFIREAPEIIERIDRTLNK